MTFGSPAIPHLEIVSLTTVSAWVTSVTRWPWFFLFLIDPVQGRVWERARINITQLIP
jgi:hypothetical protein